MPVAILAMTYSTLVAIVATLTATIIVFLVSTQKDSLGVNSLKQVTLVDP